MEKKKRNGEKWYLKRITSERFLKPEPKGHKISFKITIMNITCFAKYNYDPITELRRQTNTEERNIECTIIEIVNTKYDTFYTSRLKMMLDDI